MADELTLNTRFYYNKAGTVIDERTTNLQIDVADTRVTHTIQNVGTSEEALDLSDVTNGGAQEVGYVLAINRDATNYVEFLPSEGTTALVRLKAGEVALFRMSDDSAPRVRANTAAVNLEFWLLAGD